MLMGVQIPSVVDQYEKRVDAHLTEAKQLISGFQQTANRYFNGDIQALINHYETSDDPIFRDDAVNIRYISNRVNWLENELKALQQGHIKRVTHVLVSADNTLMSETMQQYSYMILIDLNALIWGLISGFLVAGLLDLIFALFGYCIKRSKLMGAR
jgi:hypothetical protein